MSITVYQTATKEVLSRNAPAATTIALTASVTTGHSIVLVMVSSEAHSFTISDTRSNTYQAVLNTSSPDIVGGWFAVYHASNVTGGSVTISISRGNGGDLFIAALETSPVWPLAVEGSGWAANSLPPRLNRSLLAIPSIHTLIMAMAWGNASNAAAELRPPSNYTGLIQSVIRNMDGSASNSDASIAYATTTGPVQVDTQWNYAGALTPTNMWIVFAVGLRERLQAEFSASPTSGAATLTVVFTDESLGGATSWNWSFGNGQLSVEQNPTVNYTVAGSYTVTLQVSNGFESSIKTRTNYIVVDGAGPDPDPPVPTRPGIPTSGQLPLVMLAAAYGPGFAAAAGYGFEVPMLLPPPPPEFTADEVELDQLEEFFRSQMPMFPDVPNGADLPQLERAVREIAQIFDGLVLVGQVRMTGQGEFEMITGGTADGDAPTDTDPGFDGDVWVEWPERYPKRRKKLPPEPLAEDIEEPIPTIWICVLDDNGTPQWFELELYVPGQTSSGLTGSF